MIDARVYLRIKGAGQRAISTPAMVFFPRRSTSHRPCRRSVGAGWRLRIGDPHVVDVRTALADRPACLVHAADQAGLLEQHGVGRQLGAGLQGGQAGLDERGAERCRRPVRPASPARTAPATPRSPPRSPGAVHQRGDLCGQSHAVRHAPPVAPRSPSPVPRSRRGPGTSASAAAATTSASSTFTKYW